MASRHGLDDSLSLAAGEVWTHLTNTSASTFPFGGHYRRRVLAIYGWDGIGRSLVVRRVIEQAKKSSPWQRFDQIVHIKSTLWTSQFELTRSKTVERRDKIPEDIKRATELADIQEVQSKMVVELGITLAPSARHNYYAAATQISEFLRSSGTRLLFIFECYWTSDHFERVLEQSGVFPTGSLPWAAGMMAVITPINPPPIGSSWQGRFKWDLEGWSTDDTWRILKAEAMDIASNINLAYSTLVTGDHVMDCYSYLSLFHHHPHRNDGYDHGRESIMQYWRCEGFMGRLALALENKDVLVEDVMSVIYWILTALGLLPMRDLIKKIVASVREPPFLVRCNQALEEAPKASEWEATRHISLSHNNIKTLLLLPNSPHLSTLFLNDNILLQEMSDEFFRNLTGLLVLDLSSTAITSLPYSLSCLRQLRMLRLRNCKSLELLPRFLKDHLQKLEILDLKDTPLPRMLEASFDGMTSLQYLDISGGGGAAANLTQLSVRGCRSLTKLMGLDEVSKLIALDLSGTRIQELPHQIFNLTSMERLDLLEMDHLKNVPWERITQLPKQLNWQRCSLNPLFLEFHLQGTNGKFIISASDAAVFHNLDGYCERNHLQNFYFLVCSCEGGPKDGYAPFKKCTFLYSHIFENHRISARHKRVTECERWMEVCGGKTSLEGIEKVLPMLDSFYLHGNEFAKIPFETFSEFLVDTLMSPKLCWIEKCPQLETVFDDRGRVFAKMAAKLEIVWLSDLAKLKGVFGGGFGDVYFEYLTHMFLECCPKLINIFPWKVRMHSLESLEIKFCGRLQEICHYYSISGQEAFPKLVKLCLWELPKLKTICCGDLPMLKELRIRGCPLLVELPLLSKDTRNS